MAYGAAAPAYWNQAMAGDETCLLEEEQCVIRLEHFFIRAMVVLPVVGGEPNAQFEWGVWVSLSPADFERMTSMWTTPGREQEPPYFGWLATQLPYTPTTLNLKTNVRTQPIGKRPLVQLEPTDHPLAVEQRTGVTMARVQEIAEAIRHPVG
jgi:hypothetical protein